MPYPIPAVLFLSQQLVVRQPAGFWAAPLLHHRTSSADLDQTGADATVSMTNPSPAGHTHEHSSAQDVALHMIAAAARILLMLGTAVLIGEVAAGPTRKLIEERRHRRNCGNEDGEPND